eukprot:CAMPEP_0182545990 /NCGR_PEP_ID=MMETSP1323-20130603/35340_1 /TAXON_ID=236787 /ORGANISM="Florenciella parvula, Strain RCC1693" /LENGTH=58 /DNA_ID=CAMNT_0024757177 /DNA_START=37 /DNA_END=213 /DNA_ORIENTATION=-
MYEACADRAMHGPWCACALCLRDSSTDGRRAPPSPTCVALATEVTWPQQGAACHSARA